MQVNVYERLKTVYRFLVPSQFRNTLSSRIRKSTSWIYRGSKYECNICGSKLARFLMAENGNIICPHCGSTERARSIWYIAAESRLDKEARILHFSPNPALREKFKSAYINYLTSDFSNEFEADVKYDITDIPENDESFDQIICMHVLEHIDNDQKAMQELFRILKNGGKCIIQTPFKKGETYENPSVKNAAKRLEHFGQEDHVRIYSVEGLTERLALAKFKVSHADIDIEKKKYYKLSENPILIATKLLS